MGKGRGQQLHISKAQAREAARSEAKQHEMLLQNEIDNRAALLQFRMIIAQKAYDHFVKSADWDTDQVEMSELCLRHADAMLEALRTSTQKGIAAEEAAIQQAHEHRQQEQEDKNNAEADVQKSEGVPAV